MKRLKNKLEQRWSDATVSYVRERLRRNAPRSAGPSITSAVKPGVELPAGEIPVSPFDVAIDLRKLPFRRDLPVYHVDSLPSVLGDLFDDLSIGSEGIDEMGVQWLDDSGKTLDEGKTDVELEASYVLLEIIPSPFGEE